MSDYITLEMQEEIIKRFPVRSLIRCRSVSKAWKALIDSPQFIAAYSLRHPHPHHLLISYVDMEYDKRYVSIVDDETFPEKRFTPTLPLSIKQLPSLLLVGTSGGLFCFYSVCPKFSKCIAVVWNLSIRKSVDIDVPNVKYGSYVTVLGFGVCPLTGDAKIVKIIHTKIWLQTKSTNIIPWNVEIYSLSSGEWRTLSCNLPRPSIEVTWEQVVIDKFIYWLAFNRIAINGGFRRSYTIISFDLTNDQFREVCLPDSLIHQRDPISISKGLSISKVWESLAVLEYSVSAGKRICVVWRMEHGVPKSFTRLFTIKTPHASIETLGFRKGDKPIIEAGDYDEATLVVYEPYSGRIDDIGISGLRCTLSVNSYMETLLLLNQ